jgi:elongation factor Ts
MGQITAELIKELRERSGVGIGKCKEALEATRGDMDGAIEWLRKAGIASAVKKEGRATNEGQIGVGVNGDCIAIVEVNAETDFVVNNEKFQKFLASIAQEISKTKPKSLELFSAQKASMDQSMTIDEYRASLVQTIGENIQIRRFKLFEKGKNRSIGVYSHLGGKIVTVVEIEGSNSEEELAKEIAMHVAAAAPDYINPEEVPEQVMEKERDIFRTQMKGKPDAIIEKILAGKMNSYFNEVCLNRQPYIKDDKSTVADIVNKRGKVAGKPLKITGFIRWSVGQ